MNVRYLGQTVDTYFGSVLFEADRTLKMLMQGRDNLNNQPLSVGVPGYRSLVSRVSQNPSGVHCTGTLMSYRMWFQPKEIVLRENSAGTSMVLDRLSMELLHETKRDGAVISDPESAAFAAHLTQNFAAYAARFPVLTDMLRLGELVGLFKWMHENALPVDFSFAGQHVIEYLNTPRTTPAVLVTDNSGSCYLSSWLWSLMALLCRRVPHLHERRRQLHATQRRLDGNERRPCHHAPVAGAAARPAERAAVRLEVQRAAHPWRGQFHLPRGGAVADACAQGRQRALPLRRL